MHHFESQCGLCGWIYGYQQVPNSKDGPQPKQHYLQQSNRGPSSARTAGYDLRVRGHPGIKYLDLKAKLRDFYQVQLPEFSDVSRYNQRI